MYTALDRYSTLSRVRPLLCVQILYALTFLQDEEQSSYDARQKREKKKWLLFDTRFNLISRKAVKPKSWSERIVQFNEWKWKLQPRRAGLPHTGKFSCWTFNHKIKLIGRESMPVAWTLEKRLSLRMNFCKHDRLNSLEKWHNLHDLH